MHVSAGLVGVLALGTCAATTGTGSIRGADLGHTRFAARVVAPLASTNWAGYAATSPDPANPISFTSVTATWRQAKATCGRNDADSASAFWIGLGGYNEGSRALEQIGTSADCSAHGPASYYAWYELVPLPPISFAMKIRPGDLITTSVNVSGRTVTLRVKDRTRGTVATQRVAVQAPDLSSAEWIVEAPSSCGGDTCNVVPLANFGSIVMSEIATIGNGHPGTLADPSWAATPMQIVPGSEQVFYSLPDGGYVRYTSTAGTCLPAALTAAGRSFTLSWASTASENC
jgi:hypothetical protein